LGVGRRDLRVRLIAPCRDIRPRRSRIARRRAIAARIDDRRDFGHVIATASGERDDRKPRHHYEDRKFSRCHGAYPRARKHYNVSKEVMTMSMTFMPISPGAWSAA